MLRIPIVRTLPFSSFAGGSVKTSSPSSIIHCQRWPAPHDAWGAVHQRCMSHKTQSFKVADSRSELWKQKRVVVKLGSAVITREDNCGLALGRLASIVEQVAQLQKQKKEMIIVTSGAVAFGKQQLLQESLMSRTLRQNLNPFGLDQSKQYIESRACAAVGQNGLMSMYDTMFQQYGFKTAQVLVNKEDFDCEFSRQNLKATLFSLCALNTIPIINTNDAMAPSPEPDRQLDEEISIKDNDSLAARLAVEIEARLLIIMSDVNGLYTAPPGSPDARLISTYCPNSSSGSSIVIGDKSRVGVGGMDSKVKAATWALNNGTSVVICNGHEVNAILKTVDGKKVGTFFTTAPLAEDPVELQAQQAHDGGLRIQTLTGEERAMIIHRLADLLLEHKTSIINANHVDLSHAHDAGESQAMMGRLHLSEEKLESLSTELRQVAARLCSVQGQVLKSKRLAKNMELRQVTVPVGVLLVIADESHPETLPQMAALSVCTGNGLLVKGVEKASETNKILHTLVQEALEPFVPPQSVGLVGKNEDISDLLQMRQHIDLVIPRGSPALVRHVQNNSQHIPVLGHSEGACHVYIDENVDPEMALRIVVDSKRQSPDASNTMETLLIHKRHRQGPLFDQICEQLKKNKVNFKPGSRLHKLLHFGPSLHASRKTEPETAECTIEIVESVDEAIEHINRNGSSHTDTIVTLDDGNAEKFLQLVDSAFVFQNTSTCFSDGFICGLGTEVGFSPSSAHTRGQVGVESLLKTKWIIRDRGQDLADGSVQLDHQTLPAEDISKADVVSAHFANSASELDLVNEESSCKKAKTV